MRIKDEREELDDFFIETSPAQEKKNDFTRPLLFYLLGIVVMGIATFHIKVMNMFVATSDANTMVFFRCLLISLCSLIVLRHEGKTLPSYSEVGDSFWLTVRNFSNYISATTLILCMNYMRLATAIVFSALSPVFACVFSVVILKEKFYPRYIIGIIVCLGGSLIMVLNEKAPSSGTGLPPQELLNATSADTLEALNPIHQKSANETETEEINYVMNLIIGTALGVAHSVSLALFSIGTKVLLNKKIDSNIMMYYLGVFIMVCCFAVGYFINKHNECLHNGWYIFHVCLNGFVFYVAFQIINYALNSKLQILHTTSIGYIGMVESFILGSIFLGESVYLSDVLGSAIIVGYNVLNALFPIKH